MANCIAHEPGDLGMSQAIDNPNLHYSQAKEYASQITKVFGGIDKADLPI